MQIRKRCDCCRGFTHTFTITDEVDAARAEGAMVERNQIKALMQKRIMFLEVQPLGKFHGGRIDELQSMLASIESGDALEGK